MGGTYSFGWQSAFFIPNSQKGGSRMKIMPEKDPSFWALVLALSGAVLNAAAIGWTVFQGQVNPLLHASINMALGNRCRRCADQSTWFHWC